MIVIGRALTLDQVFTILRFEADLARIRITPHADGTYDVARLDPEGHDG